MIKYRLAKKKDFEEVLAIENECFKEPYSRADLEYEFNENPVNTIIVLCGSTIGIICLTALMKSSTGMSFTEDI